MLRPLLVLLILSLSGCAQGEGYSSSHGDPRLGGYQGSYHMAMHDPDGPSNIIWRIHVAPGYEPVDGVLDFVADELARAIQKPVTPEMVVLHRETAPEDRWSATELYQLSAQLKHALPPEDSLLLHSVSMGGCYHTKDRSCVGGVEVDDVAYVFFDGKHDHDEELLADKPYVGHRAIERYIFLHELGHAIGLVNTPVPPINADRIAEDGCDCHSTDEDSVMTGQGQVVIDLDNPKGPHGHILYRAEGILADQIWNAEYNANDIDDLRAYQAELSQR